MNRIVRGACDGGRLLSVEGKAGEFEDDCIFAGGLVLAELWWLNRDCLVIVRSILDLQRLEPVSQFQ